MKNGPFFLSFYFITMGKEKGQTNVKGQRQIGKDTFEGCLCSLAVIILFVVALLLRLL